MHMQDNTTTIQYPLNNDIMFALVMNDAELCRGLLERIFPGRKIRMLKVCDGSDVEVQNTIFTGMISKSVRLDVLFEDEDSLYSIEMQRFAPPGVGLPTRSFSPSQLKLGRKGNTSEWRRKLMTLEEKIKLEVEMAREEAFKDGELKGKTEAKKMAASKMKEKGFDIKEIADITGLTVEETKNL